MNSLWNTTNEQIFGCKDKAYFLKNKKLPGFSWKKFVDSGKVAIFVTDMGPQV